MRAGFFGRLPVYQRMRMDERARIAADDHDMRPGAKIRFEPFLRASQLERENPVAWRHRHAERRYALQRFLRSRLALRIDGEFRPLLLPAWRREFDVQSVAARVPKSVSHAIAAARNQFRMNVIELEQVGEDDDHVHRPFMDIFQVANRPAGGVKNSELEEVAS